MKTWPSREERQELRGSPGTGGRGSCMRGVQRGSRCGTRGSAAGKQPRHGVESHSNSISFFSRYLIAGLQKDALQNCMSYVHQRSAPLISAGTRSYCNNKTWLIRCEGLFKCCISLVQSGGTAWHSLPLHHMPIKKKKRNRKICIGSQQNFLFGFKSLLSLY